MAARSVNVADVQAVGDVEGLTKLFEKLGYDTSAPTEQTAAALGVAEKGQAMVRQARRIVAHKAPAGPLPALEIYWFEVTSLTAELRRMLASAFRNKPLLRYLLVLTERDFGQLDFVLVEKSIAEAAAGAQVAVTHQLFSVDRRHPSRVHLRVINRMANIAPDPYAQSDRIRDAFRLAEWSEDAFNNRNLFSDYFLTKRLTEQSLFPIWHGDFKPAYKQLRQVFTAAGEVPSLSAQDYIDRFMLPMLEGLGFVHTATKSDDEADYVLKPAKDAPPCAALLVYPWDRPLDRKDEQPTRPRAEDVPGIRVVKVLEEQKLPWAILTNGKDWRLYCAAAHSRATNYYEIDLPDALEREDLIAFRYFYLFFRAESFVPAAGKPALLDQLREGSAAFAKELGDKLRKHIFDDVFPYLAQGFVDYRKQKLDEKTSAGDDFLTKTYDATLTLLYRLLFLLYAEALDLVPVNEPAYAELSLSRLKSEVADAAGVDGDVVETKLKTKYSKSDTKLYDRITKLVAVIDAGSKDHNVPTYNGGLFSTAPDAEDKSREAEAARFLRKHKIADFYLARALDLLARGEDSKTGRLEFIDYKSLGVRQLGSIYEGLLMYHVVIPQDDWEKGYQREGLKLALVPSNKERKSTGSYFTPQHIVKYIVTQTVGPLLHAKFKTMAPKLRAAQREYHEQKKFDDQSRTSRPRDAAEAIFKKYAHVVHELLDMKVLDPAMGSGHFLVETVDFITDKLLDFIAGFPWNPIQFFIDRSVRGPIVRSLNEQGVKINENRLTDVNLIKRLVMKRCVYGVDLNPMAVELAKVSLWLDSFTVGAPLSFMDHHFRCGNSLIGASIADLKKAITDSGSLFAVPTEPLEQATRQMELIAKYSDATLDEVHQSAQIFETVQNSIRGYRVLLDCLTAEHFGVQHAASLVEHGGDLDLKNWNAGYQRLTNADKNRVDQAATESIARRFFHWDVEFPDVFFSPARDGGARAFDAIVGNPPYDELSEDEAGMPLPEKRYLEESALFAPARGGRQNLFRFFILVAMRLIRQEGRHGFIVPLALVADQFSRELRLWMFRNGAFQLIEAFPQKDDPSRRVFEEAKLPTALYVTSKSQNHSAFPVRTHAAQYIEESSRTFACDPTDLQRLDPDNMMVPLIAQEEWELLQRLAAGPRAARLRDYAKMSSGEIVFNESFRPYLTSERRGALILRGGNVQRYVIIAEPKQGEPIYLKVKQFLANRRPGGAAFDHKNDRVVFQECAAIDNYRRIIPAYLPAGSFCGHKICYFKDLRCDPFALLAVFGGALLEWVINAMSVTNSLSAYQISLLPFPRFEIRKETQASRKTETDIEASLWRSIADTPDHSTTWPPQVEDGLSSAGRELTELGRTQEMLQEELRTLLRQHVNATNLDGWIGIARFDNTQYFGWEGRYPSHRPDEATLADGRWFGNAVAPPLSGVGPGGLPWDLIARVYPSFPLPGISFDGWESVAWEELCDFLRKNKTKIGNTKIRADIMGSDAVTNPTGPLKRLYEMFLKFHREIRENRAKAAEFDFLIDRIVFKLFELTLDEQKLILSRVGPGRPLPPRRGRRRGQVEEAAQQQLFGEGA